MRLVAHRGLAPTLSGHGSNSMPDFERALRNGADIEVDVRYHGMGLYCSHDPFWPDDISDDVIPSFASLCNLLERTPNGSMVFVNVKCDGTTPDIHDLAHSRGVLDRIVTFDHSMPDFLTAEFRQYENGRYRVSRARRSSPYESPVLMSMIPAPYIWLDPIGIPGEDMVQFILRRLHEHEFATPMAKIVVVSPDVHVPGGTSPADMHLLAGHLRANPQVYGVLTDMPQDFGFKVVR